MFSKQVVAALLLASASASTTQEQQKMAIQNFLGVKVDQYEVAKIMQGIITAFGGKMSLEDVLVCIGTELEALNIINNNVKLLEADIKAKKYSGVASDVLGVVEGVWVAERAIPVCTGTFPTDTWDYAGMINANKILDDKSSLKVFEDDVLIHGISILVDTAAAVKSFEAGDYEKFGENFGKILKIISYKSPILKESFSNLELAQMVSGIMKSMKVGNYAVADLN